MSWKNWLCLSITEGAGRLFCLSELDEEDLWKDVGSGFVEVWTGNPNSCIFASVISVTDSDKTPYNPESVWFQSDENSKLESLYWKPDDCEFRNCLCDNADLFWCLVSSPYCKVCLFVPRCSTYRGGRDSEKNVSTDARAAAMKQICKYIEENTSHTQVRLILQKTDKSLEHNSPFIW